MFLLSTCNVSGGRWLDVEWLQAPLPYRGGVGCLTQGLALPQLALEAAAGRVKLRESAALHARMWMIYASVP